MSSQKSERKTNRNYKVQENQCEIKKSVLLKGNKTN